MNDDPLPRLRVWLTKCRRHAQAPSATEIGDMIGLAVGEIERLRAVVDQLLGDQRQQVLEQIVTGRRGTRRCTPTSRERLSPYNHG